MRYERVKIARDTNTVHSRDVPPWEIPLIEFLFDEGNVTRTGVFVTPTEGKLINKGEYPDAKTELNRLIDAYKQDPKTGIPYAISVYGNGRTGERMLQKLIDEAKDDEAEDAKVKAPVKATGKPRSRRASSDADSLLS
jgi:hypothetical protein